MTASDLIERWDLRDSRYAADPRAGERARAMENAIRLNRYAEAQALSEKERPRALAILAGWRPPIEL